MLCGHAKLSTANDNIGLQDHSFLFLFWQGSIGTDFWYSFFFKNFIFVYRWSINLDFIFSVSYCTIM